MYIEKQRLGEWRTMTFILEPNYAEDQDNAQSN